MGRRGAGLPNPPQDSRVSCRGEAPRARMQDSRVSCRGEAEINCRGEASRARLQDSSDSSRGEPLGALNEPITR